MENCTSGVWFQTSKACLVIDLMLIYFARMKSDGVQTAFELLRKDIPDMTSACAPTLSAQQLWPTFPCHGYHNCLAPPCKVPINRDKRATDTPSQIFSDYFSAFSRIPSQIEMIDPSRALRSPSPHIRQKSDRKKKKQKGSEEDRDEEGGARVVRRG